jgi:hypothetical protein
MKKLMIIAGAAALLAVADSTQAQVVLSGTSTWANTGATGPNPDLTVAYSVFDASGLYTYSYTLTVAASNPVNGFTVDASFVNPGSANLGGLIANGFVVWTFVPGTTSTTVSFTSNFAPTLGGGSAFDGVPSVAWSATASQNGGSELIAVPVPEASTVMAGALMVLPLGIGAIRALRKERTA